MLQVTDLSKNVSVSGDTEVKAVDGVKLHRGRPVCSPPSSGAAAAARARCSRCSAQLDKPTNGTIEVDGRGHQQGGANPRAHPLPPATRSGSCFQSYNLIPEPQRVAENVIAGRWSSPACRARRSDAEARRRAPRPGGSQGRQAATSACENCSGGEQQRVAIARALANRPKADPRRRADRPNLDSKTGPRDREACCTASARSEGHDPSSRSRTTCASRRATDMTFEMEDGPARPPVRGVDELTGASAPVVTRRGDPAPGRDAGPERGDAPRHPERHRGRPRGRPRPVAQVVHARGYMREPGDEQAARRTLHRSRVCAAIRFAGVPAHDDRDCPVETRPRPRCGPDGKRAPSAEIGVEVRDRRGALGRR